MSRWLLWPLVAVVAIVWLPLCGLVYIGKISIPTELVKPTLLWVGGAVAFLWGLAIKQPELVRRIAHALMPDPVPPDPTKATTMLTMTAAGTTMSTSKDVALVGLKDTPTEADSVSVQTLDPPVAKGEPKEKSKP